MTKKRDPKPNPADLRGWGAKKLEDYELALRHVDDDPSRVDVCDGCRFDCRPGDRWCLDVVLLAPDVPR